MPSDVGIPAVISGPAAMSTAEVPPTEPQYYTIQRRGARVRIQEGVPVQLHFWDAQVVDISRSGVLLEHTERVRPGEVYWLSLQAETRRVKLLVRAIRSFVSQLVPRDKGEGRIVYRTGMEFVEAGNDAAERVSESIAWMRQQGRSES